MGERKKPFPSADFPNPGESLNPKDFAVKPKWMGGALATPPPLPQEAFWEKEFEMGTPVPMPDEGFAMGGGSTQGGQDGGEVASESELASFAELASFQSELNAILKDVPASQGKGIDEVIKVSGVRFDPKEIQAAMQEEIKAREAEVAELKSIRESIIEGVGEVVGNLKVFEKIGEEDEWGLRKVKFALDAKKGGKFNFIDRDNRIVCPMPAGEWFDEVEEFKPVQSPSPLAAKGLLALVKRVGKDQFLSQNGELYDATLEQMAAYFRPMPQKVGKSVSEERTELPLEYVSSLVNKVSSLSRRFGDDKKTQTAFAGLAAELSLLKDSLADKGWAIVLLKVKDLIDSSELNGGHRAHLYFELMSVARDVKLDAELVDILFPLGKVDRENCVKLDQFDKGLVMRITEQDRIRFDLVTADGISMYPNGLSLDYVGPFVGQVARVRKGDKWSFIRKTDGERVKVGVGKDEFDEVFDAHKGLTRVRVGQKFNYMSPEGRLLAAEFFDQAGDFDKKGQAQVRRGDEKFVIDVKGGRVAKASMEGLKFAKYFFNSRKKGVPVEELRQRVMDAIATHGVEEEMHRRFGGLLLDNVDEVGAIVEIYGKMRSIINAHVEGVNGIAKGGRFSEFSTGKMMQELLGVIAEVKLPKLRFPLRQFVLEMGELNVGPVGPLPLTLHASFADLIGRHQAEEKKLIILVRAMEDALGLFASKDNTDVAKLQSDFERHIQKAGLMSGTRREVRGVILGMMASQDSYWIGGDSMKRYVPKTPEGVGIQEMRMRPSASGVPSRALYNPLVDLDFSELCRKIDEGDLEMVKRASAEYLELVRKNPKHPFAHRKMGVTLYNAIQRLGARDPSLFRKYSGLASATMDVAMAEGEQTAKDLLGRGILREQEVGSRAPRLLWIPGLSRDYAEILKAGEDYRRGMDSRPPEPLRSQLELRSRGVSEVIRRVRLRCAVSLLVLASAGGAIGYGVYHVEDQQGSIPMPTEAVKKPTEPAIGGEMNPRIQRPDAGKGSENGGKKKKPKEAKLSPKK